MSTRRGVCVEERAPMNARLAGERISYLEVSASLAYVRFTDTCNQKRN